MRYYAGTFANPKEFDTKYAAMKYAKQLRKETTAEVRVIRVRDNYPMTIK